MVQIPETLSDPREQLASTSEPVISYPETLDLPAREMVKCVGLSISKQLSQILNKEVLQRVEFVDRVVGGGMATAWKVNVFFSGEAEPYSYFVKIVKASHELIKGKDTRTSLFQETSLACELVNGEILDQLGFGGIINKTIAGGFSSIAAINTQLPTSVGVMLRSDNESPLIQEVSHPYSYNIQPLVEGRSAMRAVYDLQNTPQVTVSKMLKYGAALCDYADALIAQGCLPTDLKFANTMVDVQDRLWLIDLAGFRFQNLDWTRIKKNQIFKKHINLEETHPFGVTVTAGNFTPEYYASSTEFNLFVRRSVVFGLLKWGLQIREQIFDSMGELYAEEFDSVIEQDPPELFIDSDVRVALGIGSETEISKQNPARVEAFQAYSKSQMMSFILQDNMEIAGMAYAYDDKESKARLEELGQNLASYLARFFKDTYDWMPTEIAANFAQWFIFEFMNEDPYKPFSDAIIKLQDVFSSMLTETAHA